MSQPEHVLEARARARLGTSLNGKYKLEQLLGIGGMASVYAATHRNTKRFAVKVLHPEFSVHSDMRSRFLREGYVANSVEHPGAVAVLDDDLTEDGAAFLVMELLQGEPIDALARRHEGRLTVKTVLGIASQVLDVLAAANAKGIVHRDIKPSNIFLTRSGQIKVLDFGVARLRDTQTELATYSGLALGTPAFMPPEQALGRTREVDGQTDVWAVGATMFMLISGHIVHEAVSAQEQMVMAATKPARSLRSVAKEIPAAVARIVDRALAFAKTERWASADAMGDAVREAYRELFGEAMSSAALASLAARVQVAVAANDSPSDPMGPTLAATDGERTPKATSSAPQVASVEAAVVKTSGRMLGAVRSHAMATSLAVLAILATLAAAVAIFVLRRSTPPSAPPTASTGSAIDTPAHASASGAAMTAEPAATIGTTDAGTPKEEEHALVHRETAAPTAHAPMQPKSARPAASASGSSKPAASAQDSFDHQ